MHGSRCESRAPAGTRPATRVTMAKPAIEPWTIPFHIVIWTTLLCGFIMVMVVFLMK